MECSIDGQNWVDCNCHGLAHRYVRKKTVASPVPAGPVKSYFGPTIQEMIDDMIKADKRFQSRFDKPIIGPVPHYAVIRLDPEPAKKPSKVWVSMNGKDWVDYSKLEDSDPVSCYKHVKEGPDRP